MAENESSGTRVVAKVAHLLRVLEQNPSGISLSQISEKTAMPKSTVHRLCAALEAEQFLSLTAEGWRIGPGLARLSASAYQELVLLARPAIEKLGKRTRETVDMCVFRGHHAVSVEQYPSDQELRVVSPVGTAFAVHTTAHGKALLAAMTDKEVQQLFRNYEPERKTEATHPTVDSLLQELATIRTHGLAVDLQEHAPGVCAIGVALDTGGADRYAISLAVPEYRFESVLGDLKNALLQCKAEIEAALGR